MNIFKRQQVTDQLLGAMAEQIVLHIEPNQSANRFYLNRDYVIGMLRILVKNAEKKGTKQ